VSLAEEVISDRDPIRAEGSSKLDRDEDAGGSGYMLCIREKRAPPDTKHESGMWPFRQQNGELAPGNGGSISRSADDVAKPPFRIAVHHLVIFGLKHSDAKKIPPPEMAWS
jgi:hypothetical protein